MSASSLAVIEALRARGLVPSDLEPPVFDESHRPWFVSLMLGAAGWLAGILLLVFIGITFKPDDSVTLIVLGLVGMVGAWAMYRAESDNAFLGQLALSLSIAGQISLAIGLLQDVNSELLIAVVLLVLQLGVLVVMPDRTARTIAALFACIAWTYVVRFATFPQSDWDDWFEPLQDGELSSARVVVGWLATWTPLVGFAAWLVNREPDWMSKPLRDYLRPALSGVLITVAAGGFATEPLVMATLGPGSMGVDLGWWSLFPLLSIALAAFAAWCAFRLRNLGLLGLAIAASLVHLGRFYYLFGTSLMWKSAIMLGMGMLLIAAAYLLRKRLPAEDAP